MWNAEIFSLSLRAFPGVFQAVPFKYLKKLKFKSLVLIKEFNF